MKPLPIRTSLTVVYTVALAVVLTALSLGYHATLVSQLDADATDSLESRARGLHAFLQFTDGSPALVYNRSDPEEAAFIAEATRYFQVYDGSGRLLVQSPGLEALGLNYTPEEVAEFRQPPGLRDVRTDRGRIRLSSTVISPSPNEHYLVQVGELLDRMDGTLASFDRLAAWRILAGLLAAAFVGRWLAGRALMPLSRLAERMQAIGITNLHARVAVRGAHDELDQVAEAFNRALERVEASVGEMRQFSAALAHELRTPLAILRGEAELSLRPSSSADQLRQTMAGQIDEFDRLTRLINQILTLARADAGEIRLANEPVDLAALASSVAEQLEPVAAARGLALTCEGAGPVMVRGDAGWLQRLLLILLDNAIKFTPDGGRIAMTVSRASGLAQVTVADTGIGVPADVLPHLFERFYRANRAKSRQTEGAGLGLALAHWIAERHQATISVTSAPGEGSTFTVRLPAAPVSMNAS